MKFGISFSTLLFASFSSSALAMDIPGVAIAGNFTTLVAALGAANLVDDLQGRGTFTVFAPTDQAFADLPDGLLEYLLQPEQNDALASILMYHVINLLEVDAATAVGLAAQNPVYGTPVTTLNGEPIILSLKDMGEDLYLNSAAEVIVPDVRADNGIIHVIDEVLVPPSLASAVSVFVDDSRGSIPVDTPGDMPDETPGDDGEMDDNDSDMGGMDDNDSDMGGMDDNDSDMDPDTDVDEDENERDTDDNDSDSDP